MKRGLPLAGAVGTLAISLLMPKPPAEEEWTILIGGDLRGSLAPCGCAKPMAGGIRRRSSAYASFGAGDRTVILDLGEFAGGSGRQAELKAETASEVASRDKVSAINLTAGDAALGPTVVANLLALSGERFVSASVNAPGVRATIKGGPFTLSGVSERPDQVATGIGGVARDLAASVGEVRRLGAPRIWLCDGGEAFADRLAKLDADSALIVYRGETVSTTTPVVSPGSKGRTILRARWRAGKVSDVVAINLEPTFADDPKTQRLYQTYLARVTEEGLLERLPRQPAAEFAGNAKCGSCHEGAYEVWKKSAHGEALKTLEQAGHDRDPDCVACHVVGLDKSSGFRSRTETPDLANVGCESCHGAGAAHSASPRNVFMGKVGERSCLPCHALDHSPSFDFLTYWPRISHK